MIISKTDMEATDHGRYGAQVEGVWISEIPNGQLQNLRDALKTEVVDIQNQLATQKDDPAWRKKAKKAFGYKLRSYGLVKEEIKLRHREAQMLRADKANPWGLIDILLRAVISPLAKERGGLSEDMQQLVDHARDAYRGEQYRRSRDTE